MISCNNYDYIEVVCLFHYPVTMTLKSGEVISGIAMDTARNEQRLECIALSIAGEKTLVVLDDIATLKTNIDNPHFDEVVFD